MTPDQAETAPDTPRRIQRKRTKGWKMPEGAVYVGRPTKFGNPFVPIQLDGLWMVMDENGVDYQPYHNTKRAAASKAVELYEANLTYWSGGLLKHDAPLREAVTALAGRDLACWCPLDAPCHGDVLLEIANAS
jgi:hypothetical protein